jgi:hypothetical protein
VGTGPTEVEDVADEVADVGLVKVDVGVIEDDNELGVYDGLLNDVNEDKLGDADQ